MTKKNWHIIESVIFYFTNLIPMTLNTWTFNTDTDYNNPTETDERWAISAENQQDINAKQMQLQLQEESNQQKDKQQNEAMELKDQLKNSDLIITEYQNIKWKYLELQTIYDQTKSVDKLVQYDQKKNCIYMQRPDWLLVWLSIKDRKLRLIVWREKRDRVKVPWSSEKYQKFTTTPEELILSKSEDQRTAIWFFTDWVNHALLKTDQYKSKGITQWSKNPTKEDTSKLFDLVDKIDTNRDRHPVTNTSL